MHSDVLIVHPHKHHLLHFAAGAGRSGREVVYVTPFYQKGVGAALALLPGRIGAKACGYYHAQIPTQQVVTPFFWQVRKLASFLTGQDLTGSFDHWAATMIRRRTWQARVVVTVQDYLPETTMAAKEAGCLVLSDQILNQGVEALARIERHCAEFGIFMPPHEKEKNAAILNIADHVTVPSRYTLEGLSGYLGSNASCHLIPYGVDIERFTPAFRPRGNQRILARANSVRKGGHLLLGALQVVGHDLAKMVNDAPIEVVVMGTLEKALEPLWKRTVASLPLSIRMTAKNFAHADVPSLMANCSLFVMPSLSEGMSLAAPEAASAALPLILSKYCGIDDFVHGHHGLAIDDSVDSLSQALLEAFRRCRSWREWGLNARAMATRFQWTRYEADIAELFLNSI